MPKKTLALIIGLIIVTVILFIIALRTGEQDSKIQTIQPKKTSTPSPTPIVHTTLTLSPNKIEVAPGKQGEIEVMIDTSDNQVTGVQLELIYDPLAINNIKIVPGKLLQNGVALDKIDTKTGRITYFLAIQPGQEVVKGSGTVAVITFTARGPIGTKSSLAFLPTTLVTAQGVAESVLKTSSGTIIDIVATTTSSTILSPT